MKQSFLAAKIAAIEASLRSEYDIRMRQAFYFCEQWYLDQAEVAVAEAFGLDPDGVKKFVEVFSTNRNDFVDLWNADTPDCEYTMSKADERLREVCGPYFLPYEQRYGGMHLEDLRGKWKKKEDR